MSDRAAGVRYGREGRRRLGIDLESHKSARLFFVAREIGAPSVESVMVLVDQRLEPECSRMRKCRFSIARGLVVAFRPRDSRFEIEDVHGVEARRHNAEAL